jgi:[protein-PII] uridylyltransferase
MYATIAKIFYQPHAYSVLGTLSFSRMLRYTIPPIKKVVDMPQFDGYHKFAVDIHSLHSLYHLEHIQDDFIRELFDNLKKDEKAMLKLAVFLHDAGKGRKKDHHLVGASLFKIFARKLGFSPELIDAGERLIMYHTLMSNVAQREDIYNEKVIFSFASHFPSKTLLDMIYILTYADMNGVGGDVYNSFSAKLLRTLYENALEALDSKAMLDEAAKRAKKEQALKRHPLFTQLKRSEQNKILRIPSNLLFLRYSPQRIIEIAKRAFKTETYSYTISSENYLTIEIIRAIPLNLGYLLGKLHNLEVVNMDISKLFDEKKYFKIDFAHKIDEAEFDDVRRIIEEAFDEKRTYNAPLPRITHDEIVIDCEHSRTYAAMHLRTTNQKGLLAYVIKRFDETGIDIVTAKVHTIKNRARDMFLIEKNENFCHNTETIIRSLTTVEEKDV